MPPELLACVPETSQQTSVSLTLSESRFRVATLLTRDRDDTARWILTLSYYDA
jgi:hypothetical protein